MEYHTASPVLLMLKIVFQNLLSLSAPRRHKISVYILGNGLPDEDKVAENVEEKEVIYCQFSFY